MLGDPTLVLPAGDAKSNCYDCRYAAPEMIRLAGLGPQLDFYSLGCLGYELACGVPPFVHENAFELGVKHLNESVPPSSQRSSCLGRAGDEFFNRLLAKSATDRFSDIAAAQRALDTLQSVLAASSEPGSRPVTLLGRESLIYFDPVQSVLSLNVDSGEHFSTSDPLTADPALSGEVDQDKSVSEIPAEPQSIGRYRVIRQLGQGGFGRVFLAHDDELDRPVAIKVPNPARISACR